MKKFWIGGAISIILLIFAFHKVNMGEIVQALSKADYFLMIPAVVLTIVGLYLRAVRWRYLLQPVKSIGVPELFSSLMIGFMANNLFPAHLGELVRAYVIGKKASISKSASLATIVIERILDGFAVLALLMLVLAFSPVPLSPWMRRGVILVFAFYAAALTSLWALAYRTKTALAWIHAISRFAPKLQMKMESLFRSFVLGLEILRDGKRLGITAALSFCVWIPAGLGIYCIFAASDIHLSVWVAFFVLAWLCIGVMVPSAPGYLGTVQFVCVACLALYGVDRSRALSISILYHVSQYVPVTIVGLAYAMKEGVSFKQIKQSSQTFEVQKSDR